MTTTKFPDDLRKMSKEICDREKSLGRELNITDSSRAVRHFIDVLAEDPDGLRKVEAWVKERRKRLGGGLMPRVLTFEEWLELNPDMWDVEIECPDCDGEGQYECPHCGHEMDCEMCDGTLKIPGARTIYEKQAAAEKEKWAKVHGVSANEKA